MLSFSQFITGLSNMALWVQVPLQSAAQQPASSASAAMDASPQLNGVDGAAASPLAQQQPQQGADWGRLWNQLQTLTGFHTRLGVLLHVRRCYTPFPPWHVAYTRSWITC